MRKTFERYSDNLLKEDKKRMFVQKHVNKIIYLIERIVYYDHQE